MEVPDANDDGAIDLSDVDFLIKNKKNEVADRVDKVARTPHRCVTRYVRLCEKAQNQAVFDVFPQVANFKIELFTQPDVPMTHICNDGFRLALQISIELLNSGRRNHRPVQY
jgi:hypothetical protein